MNLKQAKLSPVRMIEKLASLPYGTIFLLWVLLIFGSGILYFVLSVLHPGHGLTGAIETDVSVFHFLNSLYFSAATATTIGYGDISPLGISRLLSVFEGAFSFFLFAVFITKIASVKQEVALKEVHKMAFESNFHKTREKLYIIRKDFDTVIHAIHNHKNVTPTSWENLLVAFEEGQSLLRSVPDFYQDNHLYTLDQMREKLLFESVYRTLKRAEMLFLMLEEEKIEWRSQTAMVLAFQKFLDVAKNISTLLPDKSPYGNAKHFESILEIEKILTSMLGK